LVRDTILPPAPSTSGTNKEVYYRIGDTHNEGLGAFALAPILNGTNAGTYEGELLTRSQAEARYWSTRKCEVDDRRWIESRKQRNQGISGDYLFDMGNDLYIDGEDADKSSCL
jgi:hypothetical protein